MSLKELISLLLSITLLLSAAGIASAQGQRKQATKENRVTGTVHMIDKETATIIIRKGGVQRRVVYNAETKFTFQNRPGSIDDVIVGRRAVCLGTVNDNRHLVAVRVDVRRQ
jgi:hypothetical protein